MTWQFMLAAVLATWNRLQGGISAHVQSADKDLSCKSFPRFSCSSHWKQRFVGQPPSDSLGAGCVNEDSCLQQGCSCRDLYI